MHMYTNPPWIYDERIAIILGWITLALALAIFFSCRIFLGFMNRRGWQTISQSRPYQKFNSFHAIYWWAFSIILFVHLLTAFGHVGIPQIADSDSPIHWTILLTGLVGSFIVGLIYFSCRSVNSFLSFFTSKGPLQLYPSFFKSHSPMWLMFSVVIAVHIAVAFHHAGIWPPLG